MSSPHAVAVLPDVELLLIGLIRGVDASWKVLTDTGDLTQTTVQVTRFGGGPVLSQRVDRARVDIDVYAATRGVASSAARTIAAHALTWRNTVLPNARIGQVRVETAPSWRPYANPNVRRFGLTLVVDVKPL